MIYKYIIYILLMAQSNENNHMDTLSEFYNNIGSKKEFNVLYTMYQNLLKSHKLENYYSGVSDNELCSTLTISLIACLKTVSYMTNRKALVIEYIKNVITLLDTTEYEQHDYSSLTEWFYSLFNNKIQTKSEMFRLIYSFSEEDTYYEAQEKMYKLLNPPENIAYHGSYINMMTLGYFPFLMVVRSLASEETRLYLINDFLKTIVNINRLNEIHNLYDEPSQASIEFDFSR